jgi:hypothetical protein
MIIISQKMIIIIVTAVETSNLTWRQYISPKRQYSLTELQCYKVWITTTSKRIYKLCDN